MDKSKLPPDWKPLKFSFDPNWKPDPNFKIPPLPPQFGGPPPKPKKLTEEDIITDKERLKRDYEMDEDKKCYGVPYKTDLKNSIFRIFTDTQDPTTDSTEPWKDTIINNIFSQFCYIPNKNIDSINGQNLKDNKDNLPIYMILAHSSYSFDLKQTKP